MLNVNKMDNEQIARDIAELKRGQEEILALLRGMIETSRRDVSTEIPEFREMVRRGADPHEAFKDIQRRKAVGRKLPTAH